MSVARTTARSTAKPVASSVARLGGGGGAVSVPLNTVATAYRDEVNSVRSGADMTEASVVALSNFIYALQGTAYGDYTGIDVWDNVRLIAFTDTVLGVGEGTVITCVIADDGSGNPVDASDANQEAGTQQGGAHWGSYQTSSQYSELPFPSATFDYTDYTLLATLDAGASSGVNTILSVEVTGELVTNSNTSEWRWFAGGRFDGFGSSNRFQAAGTMKYQFQRLGFVRSSLSTIQIWRNDYLQQNSSLPSASASTPNFIWLGHQTSLPGFINPFGTVLIDTALTPTQVKTITDNMEILREATRVTAGSLLVEQGTTDNLLIEAATTDELLTEATA